MGAVPDQKLTIFINYRRADTFGEAQLLSDRLKQHFGEDNVYFDVEQRSGIDWLAQIRAKGAEAAYFLALIGPSWLSLLRAHIEEAPPPRRPVDIARSEIEWALSEWSGELIPVLVNAPMPAPETLPRSIRGLCRRQAAELRQTSFQQDVDALIRRLEQPPPPAPSPTDGAHEDLPLPPRTEGSHPVSSVPEPDNDHFVKVMRGMLQGIVVPLLGPSVRGSLPDSRLLAERLADEFKVDVGSAHLAEIAQRIVLTEGETQLYAAMRNILEAKGEPLPFHRFLAEFPRLLRQHGLPPRPQLIISTNYDWALEAAFEDANEPFDYAVYMARDDAINLTGDVGLGVGTGPLFVHFPWGENAWQPTAIPIREPKNYAGFPIDRGELARTIIVKMNGAVDRTEGALSWERNYVITEDDYIDYLPSQIIQNHLPIQILAKVRSSRCLFLGYSLRDWNARVLLRRIWQGQLTEPSWAVVPEPDELEESSWRAMSRVELLAANSTDYVSRLRSVVVEWLDQQPRTQLARS